MKKRTIVVILSVCLLLVSFSGCNNSKKPPNPASDFKYTVDTDKREVSINKYIGTGKEVVIPSHIEKMPVVALDGVRRASDSPVYEGVFYNTDVVTVEIPETVRTIGFASFGDCNELVQVFFKKNSSLLSIANTAFSGCVNLEKIDFSDTDLKIIGMYAFKGCSALKDIQFPDTLEQIGEGVFYECSSLVDVKIPPNVTKLGAYAFSYCTSLKRINIPSKLDLYFGEGSALNNVPALSQIVFDEGREDIVGYALVQTDASIEIIVPKSVKRFSSVPFLINSSTHITITFLGDAPEIVEDDNTDWFGIPTINYDPTTKGWDAFSWNGKYVVRPIEEK